MPNKNYKKKILVDLDGVLNQYSGNFKEDYIPPVSAGAKEFLEELSQDFEIKIFTARNKILAAKWVMESGLTPFITDVTDTKELAWLYIDDRCIKFDGNFDNLTEKIKCFKPWHKAKIQET